MVGEVSKETVRTKGEWGLKFRGALAQRIFALGISATKPDASVLEPYRLERAWRRSAGRRGRYFGTQTLRVAFSQHGTIRSDWAGEIEEPSSRTVRMSVPRPVSWTREGYLNIAPPPLIVDPDATGRSRFIGHAAIAAARAATGV